MEETNESYNIKPEHLRLRKLQVCGTKFSGQASAVHERG